MPRGGKRIGAGAKPKPPEERRVRVEVRLPPATAEMLRALAALSDASQADVIVAALECYDAYVRSPPAKRRHVVVG